MEGLVRCVLAVWSLTIDAVIFDRFIVLLGEWCSFWMLRVVAFSFCFTLRSIEFKQAFVGRK